MLRSLRPETIVALVLMLVTLAAVSCGDSSDNATNYVPFNEPVAPNPTPNIKATVAAPVAALTSAPLPTYTPSSSQTVVSHSLDSGGKSENKNGNDKSKIKTCHCLFL